MEAEQRAWIEQKLTANADSKLSHHSSPEEEYNVQSFSTGEMTRVDPEQGNAARQMLDFALGLSGTSSLSELDALVID